MQITNISSQFNKNNYPAAPQVKHVAFGSFVQGVDNLVAKRSALTNLLKHLEFDGSNMSVAALYTVIMGGVIAPRFIQAREENERKEIVFRDTISVATVVFAFKILEHVFAKICSKKSGFALAIKPAKHDTIAQKLWNYIKPATGIRVLSNSEIVAKYANINEYRDGLGGFMSFVDRQGGDIKKVFKADKEALDFLVKMYNRTDYARLVTYKNAKNKDIIISAFEAMARGSKYVQRLYGQFKPTNNAFVKKAQRMNSSFNFLSMFIIVPVLLGWTIPKMNERFTKERQKEKFVAQVNAEKDKKVQP